MQAESKFVNSTSESESIDSSSSTWIVSSHIVGSSGSYLNLAFASSTLSHPLCQYWRSLSNTGGGMLGPRVGGPSLSFVNNDSHDGRGLGHVDPAHFQNARRRKSTPCDVATDTDTKLAARGNGRCVTSDWVHAVLSGR